MFLSGPFMTVPFMALPVSGSNWTATGTCTASFIGTSRWDELVADDTAPIIYLAALEPGVLSDRS